MGGTALWSRPENYYFFTVGVGGGHGIVGSLGDGHGVGDGVTEGEGFGSDGFGLVVGLGLGDAVGDGTGVSGVGGTVGPTD